MSKFLSLIHEHDPANNEDPKWKLIDFLKSKGINASLVGDSNMLYIDTGEGQFSIAVNVANPNSMGKPKFAAEEEQELANPDQDINDEVENIAGKAGMIKGPQAKTAAMAKPIVAQRQAQTNNMVQYYKTETDDMTKQLRDAQAARRNRPVQ